jgi:hypothetical protein
LDAPHGSDLVYAEVATGKVIAMTNTHLPSDPYGPYLVRDGGSIDDLLALESEVVGESAYADTDIAVDPWPSDHRGVVSTYLATHAHYIVHTYTGARPSGSGTIDEQAFGAAVGWPIGSGSYEARLLADDGYPVLAESRPFTVGLPAAQASAPR